MRCQDILFHRIPPGILCPRPKRQSENQQPYRNDRHLLSPRAASVGPTVPFLLLGKRESSGRAVPLERRKIRPPPSSSFSSPKPSEPPLISRKRIARAIYIKREGRKVSLYLEKSGGDACETSETDVPLQPQTGRDAPQESSARVCAPKGKSSLKDLHRQRM